MVGLVGAIAGGGGMADVWFAHRGVAEVWFLGCMAHICKYGTDRLVRDVPPPAKRRA